MAQFVHPSTNDITLAGVLAALADPVRLQIVSSLMMQNGACMSCSAAAPCPTIAKSTLSNHFRVLRESGLILTSKKGVEHRNIVREADIEARFPGLLRMIVQSAQAQAA
jgi:DNA-binding transcriptional ArsR family regulator